MKLFKSIYNIRVNVIGNTKVVNIPNFDTCAIPEKAKLFWNAQRIKSEVYIRCYNGKTLRTVLLKVGCSWKNLDNNRLYVSFR